jgi:cellulose synthase/poly-beta-1,6-N-acetylglucosamine synthase-like glycosyltransferase
MEEATCTRKDWLRQRSRWMKGYMQTWLVNVRYRSGLSGEGGWRGLFSTHLFLAGTVLSALINPFLWGVFAWWLVTRSETIGAFYPGPLLAFNVIALLVGNAAFIYLAMSAPLKRGWPELAPAALLTPVYWWLTSLAAYKAAGQLITRPTFWEKTPHGISPTARARHAAARAKIDAG